MRSKVYLPASLLAAGLLSLVSLPANATGCTASSVTAFGLGAATHCIGSVSGNDAQENGSGALFDRLSTGVFNNLKTWEFVGKSDAGDFETSSGNSGSWNIADGITGPFVLSLKAGNSWSAYFFEGKDDLKALGGTWTTAGVSTNKKGIAQDLSHATIYRAVVEKPPVKPQSVPEPGMAAALGLLAIGAVGKLKQNQVG